MPAQYFLPPHVHACVSGDWIIFLDLRQDRYAAVAAEAGVLSADRRSLRASAESDAVRRLAKQRMLQEAPSMTAPMPMKAVCRLPTNVAFIHAMLWARTAARGGPLLERGLDRLAAQKGLMQAATARDELAREIEAFQARRIWWPRAFVCLVDTLALAMFLLRRGHGCEVVFGAKARPFAAHCWAEAAGQVLVDDPHFVSGFSELVRR